MWQLVLISNVVDDKNTAITFGFDIPTPSPLAVDKTSFEVTDKSSAKGN